MGYILPVATSTYQQYSNYVLNTKRIHRQVTASHKITPARLQPERYDYSSYNRNGSLVENKGKFIDVYC